MNPTSVEVSTTSTEVNQKSQCTTDAPSDCQCNLTSENIIDVNDKIDVVVVDTSNNIPKPQITEKVVEQIKKTSTIKVRLEAKTKLNYINQFLDQAPKESVVLHKGLDVELVSGITISLGDNRENKYIVVSDWLPVQTTNPNNHTSVNCVLPSETVVLTDRGLPWKLPVDFSVELPNPCPVTIYAGTKLQQNEFQVVLASDCKVNVVY
ncbi:hypothetical protein QJ850_gp273 [Acanthamoeba polyphaga mimivirus]|uniref:Uncharacterized protein n=1 Tax=Acanthamoeba polyphaga mimivirus Kroon TaxID=3069720 RepID=A0A0G2YBF8_9VIRU|nr:hypothetical protein QJ850_gp273 [Acanthamoeba polyphaga mimivirus]AKI80426.1 hypothetical protein [Acanthamoeba polyphaga mimivirus Kroon]